MPVRAHLFELVRQSDFSDKVTPTLPKSALNGYLTASERLPLNVHVLFLSEDKKKTTR
jgi:hypothetical protein